MGLQVNNLVVENTLSASTLTATTLFVGTNSVAGDGSSFNSLSSTTLSGGTIYSGGTDLYNIFLTTNDGNDITRVQPGSNITTGGTGNNPIVNLVNSPSVNNITYSGTSTGGNSVATNVSATTFYSAGTNVETLIYNIAASTEDITRVQPGSNIITGGTANAPIINLAASPSINGLSVSGTGNFTGTLQSGGTDLNSIYVQGAGTTNIIPLWNGTKLLGNSKITEINSGITVNGSVNILGDVNILGTATTINTQILQTKDNNVILNFSGTYASAIGGGITVLSGQPSGVASIWGTDVNGAWSANTQIIATNGLNVLSGALQSGSTDLYNIFAQPSQVVNNINAGSNITTGGTSTSPIVNVVASPSFNNLSFSGTATGGALSATSITATTVYASMMSATTYSGGTFYGNGSGLTGVIIPSSAKGYAEMFLTNSTTPTVVSSVGVQYKLAGTTTAGALNMFIMSGSNRLQYTGSTTGFSFSVTVNLSAIAASSNQLFQVSIQKNGTIQTNTIMQTQFGSADQAIGLSGIVSMDPGDYVEIWIQNNTSNKNFIAKYMSFILSQV